MFNIEKFNQLIEDVKTLNTGNIFGKILNWDGEQFDNQILNSTPQMIGRGDFPALQESHIFLLPVWNESDNPIQWDLVSKYNKVIEMFNAHMANTYPYWKQMKNPLLALNFVNLGFLTVMQSSLYLMTDNKFDVIVCTHLLAKLFSSAGFDVVREKIEASVFGIDGIPKSFDDSILYSGYFEFHIRVESVLTENGDTNELGKSELESLNKLSKEFGEKFQIPVPTSFNRSAHVDGGYQRYLNVRFRNMGSEEALDKVNAICTKINESEILKVFKVISEYVWYDTYVDLDKGWIDF